ncbi:MAG: DUF6775 family putative metallopeptidase [Elusimicrobiota bacterium]
MRIPSFIYLYDSGKTESLNLNEISQYLKNIFKKSKIQIRDDIITCYLSNFFFKEREKVIDNLANQMTKIKVREIEIKNTVFEPLQGEIEYEKKRLSESGNKSFGILYDGFELMTILSKLIAKEESDFSYCHIVFTNQLFSTWDEGDLRYHARVSVYGFPSVISTTGIVEAPAKPREFYLKKQLWIDIYTLKEEFRGRFIDYDDLRMTEVMKGYVLQAIFYHITGNPFCKDKNCRLYNAHWQEEVIQAQLNKNSEYCKKHQKIIKQFGTENFKNEYI